jgi:DNA-binding NarL/FixJ family response regulator
MRHPQLLVYEQDGLITLLLRRAGDSGRLTVVRPELARRDKGQGGWAWVLRELRRPSACLRHLGRGGPSVVVVAVGARREDPLTLLERVSRHFPDARTVVVGDVEDPAAAALAWDLGAAYVLFPPTPREWLIDVLSGLMQPHPNRQGVP